MTSRSTDTKQARKLEQLYRTKDRGIKHSVVLRKLRDVGLASTIDWLESQGLKPATDVVVDGFWPHRPGERGFAGMVTYRCPVHGDVIMCACKRA